MSPKLDKNSPEFVKKKKKNSFPHTFGWQEVDEQAQ